MNSFLAAAAALTTTVLIASGCASSSSTDTSTSDAPRGEPVYRTGSHIPVRDTPTTTKEDPQKRAAQQPQPTGAGTPGTN
jgi:hypothetical protein